MRPIPPGTRFTRLVVQELLPERQNAARVYLCTCDCGKQTKVVGRNLKKGHTQSCGCLVRIINGRLITNRNVTHGYAPRGNQHPLYRTWCGMHNRCRNSRDASWVNYGGRGITVCDRWTGPDGFSNFLADMGPKPSPKYSLDRIDNDGNYAPENCRWTTRSMQNSNKRRRAVADEEAKRLALWLYLEKNGGTAADYVPTLEDMDRARRALSFALAGPGRLNRSA